MARETDRQFLYRMHQRAVDMGIAMPVALLSGLRLGKARKMNRVGLGAKLAWS
jgi:hypothetical protein